MYVYLMPSYQVDPVLHEKVLSIAQSFDVQPLSRARARNYINKRIHGIMLQRKFECANQALHLLAYHDVNFKRALLGVNNLEIGLPPK